MPSKAALELAYEAHRCIDDCLIAERQALIAKVREWVEDNRDTVQPYGHTELVTFVVVADLLDFLATLEEGSDEPSTDD